MSARIDSAEIDPALEGGIGTPSMVAVSECPATPVVKAGLDRARLPTLHTSPFSPPSSPRPLYVLPGCAGARDPLPACYDLSGLLARIEALCARPGVHLELLGNEDGCPLVALHLRVDDGGVAPTLRVIVTAGVHGVEPAGPAAALLFASDIMAEPWRYVGVAFSVIPLVNPFGYRTRTRGNASKLDLNRCFLDGADAPNEVLALRPLLRREHYDLGIDLHSSRSTGERGFFALHRCAEELLNPAMQRFSQNYPVLRERTDMYEFDSPGVLRSYNRGTLKDYLGELGTRWAVTIEAPAVFPYETQVQGSAEVVRLLVQQAQQALCMVGMGG